MSFGRNASSVRVGLLHNEGDHMSPTEWSGRAIRCVLVTLMCVLYLKSIRH